MKLHKLRCVGKAVQVGTEVPTRQHNRGCQEKPEQIPARRHVLAVSYGRKKHRTCDKGCRAAQQYD